MTIKDAEEPEDRDLDGSKSADDIDRAASLNLRQTEDAVRAARDKLAPEQVQNADGTWPEPDCIDCGEPNDQRRLELGKVRCVECQTILEKKRAKKR